MLTFAIVLTVVAGGLYVVFRTADLASLASRYAATRLGRTVTIDSLKIGFHKGDLAIRLHGARLANMAGGSQPSMMDVGSFDADIAPWSLIRGPVRIDRLALDGAAILLEHGAGDRANWKFGTTSPSAGTIPTPLPIVLDGRFRNVEIDMRTTSGALLRIRIDDAIAGATDLDKPASIMTHGSYDGTPVDVTVSLPSFAAMGGRLKPTMTTITLKSGTTTLSFEGFIIDPMNFDGVSGRAVLNAPTPKALLAIAGADVSFDKPLTLAGIFTHGRDTWRLNEGIGTLDSGAFTIGFKLLEGARHQPDAISIDTAFKRLDLDAYLPPSASAQQPASTSLLIDPDPGVLLDAHLAADRFLYRAIDAAAVDVKASLAPGKLSVDQLALSIAGGSAKSRFSIANTGAKAKVDFDGSLADVDLAKLAKILDWGQLPLDGPLTSHVSGTMIGATLAEARTANRIFALATMAGGTIDRHLVSLASTDIRVLFGGGKGEGTLNCLLAILDLKDGKGAIAPVRIETSDGTILGAGSYDVQRDFVDMTIGTRRSTTSFFALDVPVRISGPVGDISVAPAFGASRQLATSSDIASLPADMQALAKSSPCLSQSK